MCTSGWVKSHGACIPYTPLLYKAALWNMYIASTAPAPAPAVGAVPEQAPAPLPEAVSGPVLAPGYSALPVQAAGGSQEVALSASAATAASPAAFEVVGIESYSPGAEAEPPAATAPAPGLLPAAPGSDTAPASALGLANGSLGNADSAARPDSNGSHVMLLSSTSAGGFCILVLLAAALICCARHRKRSKQLQQQKLYKAPSKLSQDGMEEGMGGGDEGGAEGYGEGDEASPLETTPKGLRQAYAKAALLKGGSIIVMLCYTMPWHEFVDCFQMLCSVRATNCG